MFYFILFYFFRLSFIRLHPGIYDDIVFIFQFQIFSNIGNYLSVNAKGARRNIDGDAWNVFSGSEEYPISVSFRFHGQTDIIENLKPYGFRAIVNYSFMNFLDREIGSVIIKFFGERG